MSSIYKSSLDGVYTYAEQLVDNLYAITDDILHAPKDAYDYMMRCLEKYETLRSASMGGTGIRYDKINVQTSHSNDMMDNVVIAYEQYTTAKQTYETCVNRVRSLMDAADLDDKERFIIEHWDLGLYKNSLQAIATFNPHIYSSKRQAQYAHQKAFVKISSVVKKSVYFDPHYLEKYYSL